MIYPHLQLQYAVLMAPITFAALLVTAFMVFEARTLFNPSRRVMSLTWSAVSLVYLAWCVFTVVADPGLRLDGVLLLVANGATFYATRGTYTVARDIRTDGRKRSYILFTSRSARKRYVLVRRIDAWFCLVVLCHAMTVYLHRGA